MERLRQHTLALTPCVPSSYLSLSVNKSLSRVFFLRYGAAPPFGTTIIPIGEQPVPVSYDGRTQYTGVLGDSNAHHV